MRYQEKKCYATGNPIASQEGFTIKAEEFELHYKAHNGSNRIEKLVAHLNVRAYSPDLVGGGEKLVYDVDNHCLKLSGLQSYIQMATVKIQADQDIEAWLNKDVAIARGKVQVNFTQKDYSLHGEYVEATFVPKGQDKKELETIVAKDKVKIQQLDYIVLSDHVFFDNVAGIAFVRHNVKLVKNGHHTLGQFGVVNLVSKVGRLYKTDYLCQDQKQTKQQRVRSTIYPKAFKRKNDKNTSTK